MKKYHIKIIIPLVLAIVSGMFGPLIAKGVLLIVPQINPVYIMSLTALVSIALFITAFYRVITYTSTEKIHKQLLTPYLFLVGLIGSGVMSFSIIFVVMNW